MGVDEMNEFRADVRKWATSELVKFTTRSILATTPYPTWQRAIVEDELNRRIPALRHVTGVDIDKASVRRGGTTRNATCTCGWVGPERGTMQLAADDAITHEKENA